MQYHINENNTGRNQLSKLTAEVEKVNADNEHLKNLTIKQAEALIEFATKSNYRP